MASAAAALPLPLRGEGDGCCGWLSDIALLRWLGRFLGPWPLPAARGPRSRSVLRA
ncbi:hypothetical protein GCM10010215_01520 [Streptomyces virginiae]|uniref:Uncharacterized protein n=1 Tax=Streptomyces virginiae TaxID=1961 RepID=A0ABQ3NH18_STRVG|nr:hypothetical protein GCM10010215_01520 [Streptomyces virginiae]GHI12082.1 hypothetical protein Scinn_15450 [Streptomyces virginiae]